MTSGNYFGSDRHDCRRRCFKLACEAGICRFDLSISCPCVLNTRLRFASTGLHRTASLKLLFCHYVAYNRSDWTETETSQGSWTCSLSSRIVEPGKSMRQVPEASPDEQDPFFGDVPWPVDTSRGLGCIRRQQAKVYVCRVVVSIYILFLVILYSFSCIRIYSWRSVDVVRVYYLHLDTMVF
jgi:hypothetical protein